MIISDFEIMNAIESRLTGKQLDSATPVFIFKSRYTKLNPNEFPCVNIIIEDKNYAPTNDNSYNVSTRDVIMQLIVTGDDTTETQADSGETPSMEIARERIELLEAIVRNEFNNKYECLGGFNRKVRYFRIQSSNIILDNSTDRVYGVCILRYELSTVDDIE